MKNIGISSACLYPMETDLAVKKIAEIGINNIEVHFSTYSELENSYLNSIRRIASEYGINVNSVHPFYCCLESPMFFSDYNEMRFNDGLEIYKRFFNAAAQIDAKYLVFHGGQLEGASRCTVSDEEYIERYHKIYECGKAYGITLLHENVFGHMCGDISFCQKLINALGDDALFTFDNKQARRAGFDSVEFASALSGHIRNIHISDYNGAKDCILPNKGIENFQGIVKALGNDADTACWTLEVYKNAFSDISQLKTAADFLSAL